MIINPVMMRSTLKARGAHGASFSIMMFPPKDFDVSDSYRVAAFRGRIAAREISAGFAGQHGNKTVGVVFAAAICAALHSMFHHPIRAWS
jgi:hypothetical protein